MTQLLIPELEDALRNGSQERRVTMLRRVTDLFLGQAPRLSDEQIRVYDGVLEQLINYVEISARAELSSRLAPIQQAPHSTVRRLAHDDAIEAASPVLINSRHLSPDDLLSVARSKSQAHLLALSQRSELDTQLTDALLERGDHSVAHRLAGNSGARFSDAGFANLVDRSQGDDALAGKVGVRSDLPAPMFHRLLREATDTVRSRLLAAAPPQDRDEIVNVLATIAKTIEDDTVQQRKKAIRAAQRTVLALQDRGRLDEAALRNFAESYDFNEMVATIAIMCASRFDLVEQIVQSNHPEVFLVPLKVCEFEWPTVRSVLRCRAPQHIVSEAEETRLREGYRKLSKPSAERVLRFWQVRQSASRSGEDVADGGVRAMSQSA